MSTDNQSTPESAPSTTARSYSVLYGMTPEHYQNLMEKNLIR